MLIKSSISVAILGLLVQVSYAVSSCIQIQAYSIVIDCIYKCKFYTSQKAIVEKHDKKDGFVKTTDTGFTLNGEPYFIRGVNYWHGINMGSTDGGNRTRLDLELDQLAAMGVNNVRIVTSTEGPDGEPFRMRPALMDSPGKYNEKIFEGLDYFIDALGKRNMTAIGMYCDALFVTQ